MHIDGTPGILDFLDSRSLMHIYGTPSFLCLNVDIVKCTFDAYLRYSRLFELLRQQI